MQRFLNVPEFPIILFSFAFHFVWETLQVPAYEGMSSLDHWSGVLICTQATIGDVGFALTAFWVTSIFRRSRKWLLAPRPLDVAIFLAVGLVLTIGFEYYYVGVIHRWKYAPWMPILPPFGTGLSPFVQWLVVPPLVLAVARRQLR